MPVDVETRKLTDAVKLLARSIENQNKAIKLMSDNVLTVNRNLLKLIEVFSTPPPTEASLIKFPTKEQIDAGD